MTETDSEGRSKHWQDTLECGDLEVATRMVGVDSLEKFQPDDGLIRWFCMDETQPLRILDFGSGPLRNTVGLLEIGPLWEVTACDTADMLERGQRIFKERLKPHLHRLDCTTTLDEAIGAAGRGGGGTYDVCFATLVFQHIDVANLKKILNKIAVACPVLCISGRRTLDDMKTSVWDILADYYEPARVMAADERHETAGDLRVGSPHDHTSAVFLRIA